MTLKTGTLVRCPSQEAMQAPWRDLIQENAIGVVLDYPDNPNNDNEYNEYTYVQWSEWGSPVHMSNALIHHDHELEPLPIQLGDKVICPTGQGFGVYNERIIDDVGTVENVVRVGDSVQYDVRWPRQYRFSHLEHELQKYVPVTKERSQRQQEQQDGYRREVEAARSASAHMGAVEDSGPTDEDIERTMDEAEYCYQCKGPCRFELGEELTDDSDDYELDDQLYSGPVYDQQPSTGGFLVVSVTITRYIPLGE